MGNKYSTYICIYKSVNQMKRCYSVIFNRGTRHSLMVTAFKAEFKDLGHITIGLANIHERTTEAA